MDSAMWVNQATKWKQLRNLAWQRPSLSAWCPWHDILYFEPFLLCDILLLLVSGTAPSMICWSCLTWLVFRQGKALQFYDSEASRFLQCGITKQTCSCNRNHHVFQENQGPKCRVWNVFLMRVNLQEGKCNMHNWSGVMWPVRTLHI